MTSNGTEEIVDKSEEAEASRKEDGKEESVRQQPKSHLDVVPQILWLLSQSPKHKYLFVGDLEWYLLAPLQLRQFRLFNKDKTPLVLLVGPMFPTRSRNDCPQGPAGSNPTIGSRANSSGLLTSVHLSVGVEIF